MAVGDKAGAMLAGFSARAQMAADANATRYLRGDALAETAKHIEWYHTEGHGTAGADLALQLCEKRRRNVASALAKIEATRTQGSTPTWPLPEGIE